MLYHFYRVYRASELDGCVLMVFLLLTLWSLFGLRKNRRFAVYVLCGVGLYAALYYLTFFMVPAVFAASEAASPRHPYWYGFLCTAIAALALSQLCLRGGFGAKLSYVMFYLSFVQLFKVICGPLYSAEDTMPPALYCALDAATSALLYVLLGLFTVLFRRVRLPDRKEAFSAQFLLVLYFPAALLLFYGIRFSGADYLSAYSEQVLAAIILIAMPLLYFLFASLLRFFEEQRAMDMALSRATAQAERYRLSAEMEERLKIERHELKNRYTYIHTLLRQGQYERLDAYIENEIGQTIDSLSLISTDNPTIDYVLNRKLRQAQEAGIKIYSEILLPAELPVDEAAFCTVFLNLIDNAIEASADEECPDIHISVKCVRGYLRCEIKNHVRTEKITANPALRTTKPDIQNHGLGLKIVRETLRRCDGMLQTGLDASYFKAVFMLPLDEGVHTPASGGDPGGGGADGTALQQSR